MIDFRFKTSVKGVILVSVEELTLEITGFVMLRKVSSGFSFLLQLDVPKLSPTVLKSQEITLGKICQKTSFFSDRYFPSYTRKHEIANVTLFAKKST